MHGGYSGGVARQPNEMKGRVHRGIRETNVEGGVASEGVDGEFATREVFGVSEEGDVTDCGAVRSFDEELGEGSRLVLFVARKVLGGVILEGDVDGDGRVPGLENQKFSGGEVSDDGVILGPDVTTVNAQSLWVRMVSQPRNITIQIKISNLCFYGEERTRDPQILELEVSLLEHVSEKGHVGQEFLDF